MTAAPEDARDPLIRGDDGDEPRTPAAPHPAAPDPAAAIRWLPAADEDLRPGRPPRPTAIDFASTLFIVSGIFRLFAVAMALIAPPEADFIVAPGYVVLEVAIQVATVVLGVLIRFGRAWLVAANFAVVLAFIQLLGAVGVVSIVFGILSAIAFVGIFVNRPWFLAVAAWRRTRGPERRA